MTAGDNHPDDRYLTAIARRNLLWCRWRDAVVVWEAAGRPTGAVLGAVNDAQHAYEWAVRDLVRARVWWRAERAAARGQVAA